MTRRGFLAGSAGMVVAAGAADMAGCKSVPGASVVYLAGKGIGGAAGLVLNECDLSPEARAALASVVTTVAAVVPGPGETLTDTWIVAARRHVNELVAAGKVRPITGAVALVAFAVVVYAYLLLEARHPQVKVVRELACAALDGLAEGFLATFQPTRMAVQDYDVEAYRAIKASAEVAALQNLTCAVAQTEEK